jgi:hypothetical protein
VVVLLLIDMTPSGSLYAELLGWPNILSIDGMVLLWSTLTPFINMIGGIRSGLEIAKIIENVKMYWYF